MTDDNLWLSILSEARQKAMSKLPPNKSLLVLGDNGSGKTTVIAKLQGIETHKKGFGLEYAFIDVKDEYRDDQARLGVWIQDGDPSLSYLLKFALSKETFPDTTIMFVVSMTTPWNILGQLQSWATILQDHIHKLNIPETDLKKYKSKCIRRWNEYVEYDDVNGLDSNFKRIADNFEKNKGLFELKQKTLTHNLGLDVIVVVTKTDYIVTLEKDRDYSNEHFDFIQQSVRRFCLQYGAALFYTSAKEDKNCDLLYKYLIHRIYNLPFETPALTVEKDAVFIPSGWDNTRKISIICENFITLKPDDPFKDVILPPASIHKSFVSDAEVHCDDDEQTFLQRLFELQKIPLKLDCVQSLPSTPNIHRISDKRLSNSPLMQTPLNLTKKMDISNPCEGTLATFFNSLLHKKQVAQGKAVDISSPSMSVHSLTTSPLKNDTVIHARSILGTSTPTKSHSSQLDRTSNEDQQSSFSG